MFVNIAPQIIVEYIKFETQLWPSILKKDPAKKDPATRHVLKTKLSFKNF